MTNFTVAQTDALLLLDFGTGTPTRLVYPNDPSIDKLSMSSTFQTYVSVSHSLKRNARSKGGQRWGFRLTYEKLTREQFAPIMAYLLRQRGQFRDFMFAPPAPLLVPRGTVAGSSPVVDGWDQSGETLRVSGCAASTVVLKSGDFIRVGDYNKVYMVVEDSLSDSSGKMQIQISPPLQAIPDGGEAVQISNVAFNVAQTSDVREYELTAPTLYDFEVELIEVPE